MTELLPCPFCGGEAEIHGNSALFVQCGNCGTRYGDRYHTTEAEAVAAWNTRSERTCKWEYPQGVNGWVGYVTCSGCGSQYAGTIPDEANYCPNCGAKVVE